MKPPILLLWVLCTALLTADPSAEAGGRDQAKPAPRAKPAFTVVEASMAEMRAALEQHRVTSRDLVLQYLARIATYEDTLHAALTVNPHALAEADALDRERALGRIRGPLHGIPIALKDNIQTTNMRTTGGALAFESLVPPYEATIVKNLREAGAIIIAKTGMTELANWVAGAPTPMPGDYNAVGGYGMNPYDPRKDPREKTFDGRPALQTGGSSSGIRDVRIDPQPREPDHAGGDQADGGTRQQARHHSDHGGPGWCNFPGSEIAPGAISPRGVTSVPSTLTR